MDERDVRDRVFDLIAEDNGEKFDGVAMQRGVIIIAADGREFIVTVRAATAHELD